MTSQTLEDILGLKQPKSNRVFYTVAEAAEKLDCSDRAIYKKLKKGELMGGRGPGGIRLNASRVDLLVYQILNGLA